jgi:PST family polysaccharide transporter
VIEHAAKALRGLASGHVLVGRAFALSFGRGFASILSVAWVVLVARYLSLEQFGQVNVALALIIMLGALSDLGFQFVLAKDVVDSGRMRRAVLDAVVGRRLLWALVSAVVMVVLYEIATRDPNVVVPAVFSLSIVGAALYNPTIMGYRATGNIRLEVISEVGSRAVVLFAGGAWVLAGGGLLAVATSYSAVGLAVGVIDYLYVRSRAHAEPGAHPLPEVSLRAASPFALANTVGAVYQRIDNYLIGLLRGTVAAGVYGASYRFQDLNLLLPSAVGQLALAESAGADPRRRLAIANRVAAQCLVLALVPAVFLSLFAQPILTLVFGARYAFATPIVTVLLVSTLPGAAAVAVQALAAVTNPRLFAAATAGALGLNVLANLILIPPFAGFGAAIANVISQTFLFVAYYWVLVRSATAAARPAPAERN